MPVKKIFILLWSLILVFCLSFIINPDTSHADELDDINKQLSQLNDDLNKSIAATKPLEGQLTSMQKQIEGIKQQVVGVENGIVVKKREIDDGYKRLADKEKLIAETISAYYINSYYDCPICEILSLDNANDITLSLAYQRAKTNQDKQIITNLALSIGNLEKKKADLEQTQKSLVIAKASLDEQSKKLEKIVAGAKGFQSELSGKIAALSEKQQSIINAKSGSFTASINNVVGDSTTSLSAFQNNASGGSFGVFSFGAYTHRNGMSQYGALGRANQGQNAEQILSSYYAGKLLNKSHSEPSTIHVKGPGQSCIKQPDNTFNKNYDETIDFNTYLKRIWEVPETWPQPVLMAQAVAARTYAIRITNTNGSIQPNQNHQVYKDCEKGGGWPSAVESTKGWVLTEGGGPAFTEYSSTSGGWINGLGWDTTDGNGGSSFVSKTYENIGGSPWVYKSWYKDDFGEYGPKGANCGRSNPWLSAQEMADVVNAAIALRTGGIDTSRITPITTSCWPGNPYSMDELKNLVASKGGISSASSVSVSQGEGSTNSVTINGVSMTGSEFKKAFALRAPGFIRIPQKGFAFFNIEHK